MQAVRVRFENLPAPYDTWNGTVMWVQEPRVYCEGGRTTPPYGDPAWCTAAVGGLPRLWFWGAHLGCEPYFTDWSDRDQFPESGFDPVVHVFHEGIVPGATYTVQLIDSTCDIGQESDYSEPMPVTMSKWGDVVKDCTTFPCGPPDGSTGIVDVTAILDKYKRITGNVIKARADLEGSPSGDARIVDQSINITDVTFCLGAFLGATYPPPGFPPPSPPPCIE